MFDFKPTKKGLLRAEFRDRFGAVCSIQESSFPDEDCLWFGVEVDIHGNESNGGRMHLTQEMARQLMPVLRHFLRTGKLGIDNRDKFQVGTWVRGIGADVHGVEGRIVHIDGTPESPRSVVTVQDYKRPGPEGLSVTIWEAMETIWEPMEIPDSLKSRYDFITEDDDEDDAV